MKILVHPIIGEMEMKDNLADKIMRRENTAGWKYAEGYGVDKKPEVVKTKKAVNSGNKRNSGNTKKSKK